MAGILKGTVKNYDWGGTAFIPTLLHIENERGAPFAEYWMGTHPLGMGLVTGKDGSENALHTYSGNLPYLFKALDVKNMLSIQVHPSKENAAKEFERENKEGIPLDAPHRNYKDSNHKPELMVALDDFWLLHGFKPAEELADILVHVRELNSLLSFFAESGYEGLYQHIMEMPQKEVNSILRPLADVLLPQYQANKLDKNTEDFWAARAAQTFAGEDIDRGIFSIYLFNLVRLRKGEGIFQDAGVPHAYLEGRNVEIMANSDNVLRGGLTTKHIDVKELLKHTKCQPTYPAIIEPEPINAYEKEYPVPVPDFKLSMIELQTGNTLSLTPSATEIILVTEGAVEVTAGDNTFTVKPGTPSAVIFAGEETRINAATGAVLFRAGQGSSQKIS